MIKDWLLFLRIANKHREISNFDRFGSALCVTACFFALCLTNLVALTWHCFAFDTAYLLKLQFQFD